MKFWQSLAFTETDQLIETAKIVDEVGFEGAFVSDHLFYPGSFEKNYPYNATGDPGFLPETPWPQPWSAIAAMAAVTSKLRFSTLIYILPLHDPIEVAKATGTLAVLSGGRFALGAGATRAQPPSRPVEGSRASLALVRRGRPKPEPVAGTLPR